MSNPAPLTFWIFFLKRPGLICVKVYVPADRWPGVVGVCQRPALAVKQGHIAVETRGEQQQDVGELRPAAVGVQVALRGQLLEGERGDPSPRVEGRADGGVRPLLSQRGRDELVQYADARRERVLTSLC